MWTKNFWQAAAERMVRGGAIAVTTTWIAGDGILNIAHVSDFKDVVVLYISGAVGSLLLSLAGSGLGPGDGPSLTGAEDVHGE
jgi:hypothetical protein